MKGRKKIKGTTEKLIRLKDTAIYKLKQKAAKADVPVKKYIEDVITTHANQ